MQLIRRQPNFFVPGLGRRIQLNRKAISTRIQKEGGYASILNTRRHQRTRKHQNMEPSKYSLWPRLTRGILSRLPPSWVPFAELSRIEKPRGLYGFYMAYVLGLEYGACLVSPVVPTDTLAYAAMVLLVYNVFHRGAACTINDFFNRDYDKKVA